MIFAKLRGDVGTYSGVMSVAVGLDSGDKDQTLKKAKVAAIPILGFQRRIRREHSSHMMMPW